LSDYVLKGITHDQQIIIYAVEAKKTVQTAIDLHYLSITAAVTLGRLLISGLLMSAGLKHEEDLLTLRIDGDGPLGTVVVTATGANTVRGYIKNPQTELAKNEKGIAVAEAIGKGFLSVIRSIGEQHPYTGQVELISGEIGEDLCYYYHQSEQLETVINLGLLIEKDAQIRQAGGFLLQVLPGASAKVLEEIKDHLRLFPNLSDYMDMGFSIETILAQNILPGISHTILEVKPVSYRCNCNRERFLRSIKLLSPDEIQALRENQEPITAECHFCNQKFVFQSDEFE